MFSEEIQHAQECADFAYIGWHGVIPHNSCLSRIRLDAVLVDNVPQEFDFKLIEFALGRLVST